MNTEERMIGASRVADILGISESYAYVVIRELNKELADAGYLTLRGKVAGLKPITIHGLRHSHVSLLISKRYDIFEVSKRIGHKSVKTTQDTYGHLFDEVQKSIANDLDGMRRR